ncbi:hypothetical protein ACUTJJ_24335 [Agrobacterium sp. DKPNP3]
MSDHTSQHHPLFRRRDSHHAKFSSAELFFDLIYVFAVKAPRFLTEAPA